MSMTDPISDFLTRIRNGIMARKDSVDCPRSKIKLAVAEILKQEGYLDAVTSIEHEVQGLISVRLRYDDNYVNAIRGIRRVSRPGQRAYVGARDLPKVQNGLGIAIVSTSCGVMTDRQARKLNVGGEVLCHVW